MGTESSLPLTGSTLGAALLPLIALAVSLAAAVAVGSLVVAWLRKPVDEVSAADTDPLAAGLLSVGFASGPASGRWLAATIVELAIDGVIEIEDRRDIRAGESGRHRDVRLVYVAEQLLVPSAAGVATSTEGVVASVFGPGLAGESSVVSCGASIAVDAVLDRNGALAALTSDRFLDAAARYREPRPVGRFRTATFGGIAGVGIGLLSLTVAGDDAIAGTAIVVGVLSLALRAILPRWMPLNAAGLRLRERADRLRESLADAAASNPAAAGALLPWAVLLDQPAVIRRFTESAERSRIAPEWYRSAAPFSADRLASCLAIVTAELSQPIRLGAGVAKGNSRFGVPLVDSAKGLGVGFAGFAGWGGGGGADFGGTGRAYGEGGGFDVGGFDGGGYGGGDDGGYGGGDGGGY